MQVGVIKAIWRYPFKSMLGEQMQSASITERGLECDRIYALREKATHKLATARQYPQLLQYRAVVASAGDDRRVAIKFPDGSQKYADDPDIGECFSELLSRALHVEQAWDDRTPNGLFDDSHVHLVSNQTLKQLGAKQPNSLFDMRRFRANILLEAASNHEQPEQTWIGMKIRIGEGVVLEINKPCERCVMTTMPQEELPRDNDILRTVVNMNDSVVGVYGTVVTAGSIRVGDALTLVD